MTAPTRRNILCGKIAASAPTVGEAFQASRSAERQTRGRGRLKTVTYPGQDPGKFLDGFRNAYLAGKMGDKAALENSTAAAYLTEEQRRSAYALGNLAGNVTTRETLDSMHNNSTMESDDLCITARVLSKRV